jgi:hypothetical protein
VAHGTNTLPSRTYPLVPAAPTPGHPVNVAGGVGGPAPLPSRLTTPLVPERGGLLPGGNNGPVILFTPNVDKQAPYFLGEREGWSIRTVEGAPLAWLRRQFVNDAGPSAFLPSRTATPDWTSNTPRQSAPAPGSPIPISRKPLRFGALRKAAYQDEQLFDQLTDRHHPWPIQKPVPTRVRTALTAQAQQRPPFPYMLTRYTPAASFSQTGLTLFSQALTNVLPNQPALANPSQLGGIPYATY